MEGIGRYELRLFDETAVLFDLDRDDSGSSTVHVVSLGTGRLPLGLDPTDDGLARWLSTRALPLNRAYADKLCLQMGISPGDTARVVEVGRGLSLNDSYWVVPEGFDGTFDDYNLFENDFSALLSLVAYTGRLDAARLGSHGLTPELSTGGTLAKAWRIADDGTRLLYKASTEGYDPGEPFSEAATSSIGAVAGIRHAGYWIDQWDGRTCSVCACFCDRGTAYVPFAVATGKTSLPDVVATTMALGDDVFEDLADMLVLDCLCANTDRHLTNFGLMVDASSGKALGLSPVFDNGRALFPNVSDSELDALPAIASYSRPAFGADSFDLLAARVIGERQAEWLARLADVDLADTLRASGMGEVRAKALSAFLSERARTLSLLRPVPRATLAEASERFPDAKEFARRFGSNVRVGQARMGRARHH